MSKELFTFCIVATVADLERARPLCLEWIKRWDGTTRQKAEAMLPHALSASGQSPASHYLCAMCGTREQFDDMQAFRINRGVPVELALLGPQENNSRFTHENRDTWLPSQNLKMIAK